MNSTVDDVSGLRVTLRLHGSVREREPSVRRDDAYEWTCVVEVRSGEVVGRGSLEVEVVCDRIRDPPAREVF